jgi:signal peptidase II
LASGQSIVIFNWFKLQLAYNTGAAFSFLSDAGGWQKYFFSVLAVVVSMVLAVWIVKTAQRKEPGRWCELLALSLILGGAIGNVYDRITLGHVIDFIVWHYQEHYFPTFNIADSAICVGAGLLILDMLFLQKKHSANTVTEA